MSIKSVKLSANTVECDDNEYADTRSTSSAENTDSTNTGRKRKCTTDVECLNISDSSSDTIEAVTGIKSPWPSEGGQATPPENLFGLRPQFLQSLGIKPPLDNWIHVSNFRCDKSELKEVLELAGRVVMCAVITIRERYAKAMYSHPLEAVQAVSMLNGQTFYGQKLKITMVQSPTDTVILPKGLNNVGFGLGIKGKPLLDIVRHYKKFVKQQESMLDPTIFSHGDCKVGFFSSSDSKKKKLSMGFNSSFIDNEPKEKDVQDTNIKRTAIFKVISIEDMQESDRQIDKFSSKNNSPESNSISVIQSRIDESPRSKSSKDVRPKEFPSQNLQIRLSYQSSAMIPLNPTPSCMACTSSLVSPNFGSQPRPVSGPQSFTGSIGPPGVNPPGLNMGSTVGLKATPVPPGFNMNACGPPAMISSFGPPGFNAGSSGPRGAINPSVPPGFNSGPSGPPGMMNSGPPGPRMCVSGPMRMNVGPGPGSVMNSNGPGNFGPSLKAPQTLPNAIMPPGIGQAPTQPVPVSIPDSFGLEFKNLPPSTTFPLLCDKVSRCGQVLSLQLTTPGCAVARFSTRAAAERCFQVFNGLCIDGCIIESRYI